MTDEALVTKICDQDAFLNSEVNIDATFSVIKSRTSKKYIGTPNFKNVMIKCSQIMEHIMKNNDDFVYVRLSWCKSFDYFSVSQCYHCYKFNPFADESRDYYMQDICGKCAIRHKTKDCNRNSLEKCVNCVQNCERNFKLNAFSRECPAMVKATAFVMRKTDLDSEKKTNKIFR